MPRRASMFVFLGLAIALVFVTGISAGAEPDGSIRAKKADVAAAQDRLMEIRMEASAAEASYNNALYEMNQLNGQIAGTTDHLRAAKERLAEAKKTLEERAAQVYKSGNVAFMDVLVGVDDFSEFASRLNLWVRLLDRERAEFLEVREARNELAARRDRLEAQREQRVAAVETAIVQQERANEAEAQAEAYLNSLNAELRGEIRAAQDRQATRARAAAAAIVERAPKPAPEDAEPVPVEEPEPIPEVRASQVKGAQVPRADLQSEQVAAEREAAAQAAAERAQRLAEQRAAERRAAKKAAEQAAEQAAAERQAARLARQEAREEAERQAERAEQRAAERQAAREEAEREAERAARRAAIEEAAAEQAAAERQAARLAAERRAERRAEQRAAERAQASASASASASAAENEEAASEQAAGRQAEASASASAAAEEAAAERRAERRAEDRAAERTEASASASVSASASAPSSQDSTRGGGAGAASASATASASASGSPAPGGGGVGGAGVDVLAIADDHLGTPYEFSPPGPCVAFEAEDCSCFTMLVFQEFGIALPDSPGGQMGYGTPVHGAPQAGDLLFWSEDGSGYITHVGIAMGDGTTIHAQIGNEVTITSINYINGYVGARRLL
jgi:peptidoglycan DL-endopeptidase RipA